ncbi:polysaccharide biosynthesis protein [Longispora sp. K20-0274]|uniref:polysaccharide biosynthesis protein n=1 Tax=Longispora sp. K20-0274 TaxID=3088255 RepID=UPI00399C457D
MLQRLTRALPTGTIAVGGGLAVLGVASYVHIAAAGHRLSTLDMSKVSVVWSIVISLGFGLFLPVEQETARIVAARAAGGDGAGPVARRAVTVSGAILGVIFVVLAVGARPLADALFDGDLGMIASLAGALVGAAVTYAARGVLAGRGQFAAYGVQLGVDGGLRIGLSLAFVLADVRSPLAYALILTIAPFVSVLATLRPTLRACGPGTPQGLPGYLRGLGLLTVSALAAQTVVNVGVVSVKLLSPGDVSLVAALLSALILARVPIFVFAALQASLLPGLSSLLARGDTAGYHRLLLRAVGIVTALGVFGGVPAVLAGPWAIRVFFNAPDVLRASDFAILSFGTLVYMLALVLGQGALSLHRHRDQALTWALGLLVLAGVTLGPGDVRLRVEAAYVAGSAVVAVILAVLLWRIRTARTMAP